MHFYVFLLYKWSKKKHKKIGNDEKKNPHNREFFSRKHNNIKVFFLKHANSKNIYFIFKKETVRRIKKNEQVE